jgi:hypothetical protein
MTEPRRRGPAPTGWLRSGGPPDRNQGGGDPGGTGGMAGVDGRLRRTTTNTITSTTSPNTTPKTMRVNSRAPKS